MADDLNNIETPSTPTPVEPVVPNPEQVAPTLEPVIPPAETAPIPEPVIPPAESVPVPVVEEPVPVPAPVPEPIVPVPVTPVETKPAEVPVTVSEAKPLPVVTPAIETIEDYSLMRPSKGFMAWLRAKAQAALRALRQKKLNRIMTLFDKKPQVTNDMVEKLLRVSHGTATKYLNILVKDGKLKREGQGSAVHYEKI
ncbi:MAG: hypothetical protein WCV68_00450 [Candidatus Paceibacterota bacterium]